MTEFFIQLPDDPINLTAMVEENFKQSTLVIIPNHCVYPITPPR